MNDSPDNLLKKYFGFTSFRAGQKEVIDNLLSGNSSVAVFPTGAGKSLCYQLPALCFSGLTLVVSPLIALMKDQIDALKRRDVYAARLDSAMSKDEYWEVINHCEQGKIKLLYVSPERFNNEIFRELMQRIEISLFAIDEAHCVSEWGHNFRPDYLRLPKYAKQFGAKNIVALTATATKKVLDDICDSFQIDKSCAVRTGFYRPNLRINMTAVSTKTRNGLLKQRLTERSLGSTIIYVTLQKTAESVASFLSEEGFQAKYYHAGMKTEQREIVQEWFMSEEDAIVVATIAFGMGIDKSNIRYVYHYNLPKSLENYAQEIGRAGRDNKDSTCEIFANLEDKVILENFVYGDTPTLLAIKGLLNDIFSHDEQLDVNLYELAKKHDIRHLVIKTLLTYLELQGYIEGGTPFYSDYQFKPNTSSAEILRHFDSDRQVFLANLFRHSKKSKYWFKIDIDLVADKINTERERIIRALDYLNEKQMLELKVSGVRLRFYIKNKPQDIALEAQDLHSQMCNREKADLNRLNQVIELIQLNACQFKALAKHFDEELMEPCGRCSWCESKKAVLLEADELPFNLIESLGAELRQIMNSYSDVLLEPESIARMLCGITSPKLTQSKLKSHKLFGSLSGVPFETVREQVSKGF